MGRSALASATTGLDLLLLPNRQVNGSAGTQELRASFTSVRCGAHCASDWASPNQREHHIPLQLHLTVPFSATILE
jgi:hypothetical protein